MSDLDLADAWSETTPCDYTESRCSEAAVDNCESVSHPADALIIGVRVGSLVALKDDGRTPLVVFPGQQGSAAVPARATIDLHGSHIGRSVVLTFEDGDRQHPIILGCLGQNEGWPLAECPGQVDVDVDGERLVVSAKVQLVLRCGKATITLTRAGKVLIQGTYVSSRSSSVNRIRGGSVQVN